MGTIYRECEFKHSIFVSVGGQIDPDVHWLGKHYARYHIKLTSILIDLDICTY